MAQKIFHIKYTVHKCFIILLIMVGLASCIRTTTEFPLITNTTCHPPCWQNIVPGKSTEQEVVGILNDNPIIDSNSLAIKGEPWNSFSDVIYFKTKPNEDIGAIYFINDKVAMITISGILKFSFEQAIDNLGEPQYIINMPTYYGPPGFLKISYEISALIPSEGIKFSYNTREIKGNNQSSLSPGNQISEVSFFDKNSYEYILQAGMFSEGVLNAIETEQYLIPWDGYGELEQKYPAAVIK